MSTKKLNNVECRWASVIEPNTTYDPVYEIEALLNKEQAAELRKQGLSVKEKEGQLSYRFKIKQFGQKRGGGTFERNPPVVVDKTNKPFDQLIGNGSIVNIAYNLREWNAYDNSGIKGDLVAVQVVEHIPFTANGGTNPFDALEEAEEEVGSDSPF